MAERKNSEARIRANNKYAAKAYDRINLAVQKGKKDEIQAHADAHGESINGFIGRAISETMAHDSGAEVTRTPGTTPEQVEIVKAHLEKTGESETDFLSRAIATTIERDERSLRMGIPPVPPQK